MFYVLNKKTYKSLNLINPISDYVLKKGTLFLKTILNNRIVQIVAFLFIINKLILLKLKS